MGCHRGESGSDSDHQAPERCVTQRASSLSCDRPRPRIGRRFSPTRECARCRPPFSLAPTPGGCRMKRSITSNCLRASCNAIWVNCVESGARMDQYCAPTHPSRRRGISAQSVGWTRPMSRCERSSALVLRNIEARSLWPSIRGARLSSALARSSSLASGMDSGRLPARAVERSESVTTPDAAMREVC